MSGYSDTRQKIIESLMGRPEGEMIQPENHQEFALALLEYIRNVELISSSTFIGVADGLTVPMQPNNSQAVYIGFVPSGSGVSFNNFYNENGESIKIVSNVNEVKLVTLIWNTKYWEFSELAVPVLSNTMGGYSYMGIAKEDTVPDYGAGGNIFYIAYTDGNYSNFENIIVKDYISILRYNAADRKWVKDETTMKNSTQIDKFVGTEILLTQIDDISKFGGINSVFENRKFVIKDEKGLTVGNMTVMSDNMRHVFTQIFSTHYLLEEGNISVSHNHDVVYTYTRNYDFSKKTWSAWIENNLTKTPQKLTKEEKKQVQDNIGIVEAIKTNSPLVVFNKIIEEEVVIEGVGITAFNGKIVFSKFYNQFLYEYELINESGLSQVKYYSDFPYKEIYRNPEDNYKPYSDKVYNLNGANYHWDGINFEKVTNDKISEKVDASDHNPVSSAAVAGALQTEREKSDKTYVKQEVGKVLSSNDYTDEDKQKLSGLQNYDDTQIKQDIENANTAATDAKKVAEDLTPRVEKLEEGGGIVPDTEVIKGSQNAVSGGAVYSALQALKSSTQLFFDRDTYDYTQYVKELYLTDNFKSGTCTLRAQPGNNFALLVTRSIYCLLNFNKNMEGQIVELKVGVSDDAVNYPIGTKIGYVIISDVDGFFKNTTYMNLENVNVAYAKNIKNAPLIGRKEHYAELDVARLHGGLRMCTDAVTDVKLKYGTLSLKGLSNFILDFKIQGDIKDCDLTVQFGKKGADGPTYTNGFALKSNGKILALVNVGSIPPTGLQLYELEEFQGSGTSASILVDWDAFLREIMIPEGGEDRFTLNCLNYDYCFKKELGEIATYKRLRRLEDAAEKPVTIGIPSTIYAAKNDLLQIFYRGFLDCVNYKNYNIKITGFGVSHPRYWELLTDVVGVHDATIYVSRNEGVVYKKSIKVNVLKEPVQPTKPLNVLIIGSSWQGGGVWAQELARRLTKTDGHAGEDRGTVDNHRYVGFENPKGLGFTNIKFVGSDKSTDGSTSYEGVGGYNFTSYIEDAESPLWNAGKLDVPHYVNTFCEGKVDVIVCECLGCGLARFQKDFTKIFSDMKKFVDEFRRVNPDVKFLICNSAEYSPQSPYSYEKRVASINQSLALEDYIAKNLSESCTMVDILSALDAEYMYPTVEMSVNARSSETFQYVTNTSHPKAEGYKQLADACYRVFVAKFCQG